MSLQLPCAASKKELYQHYKAFNERELSNDMTEIVSAVRKIPIQKAKYIKVLRRNEVVLLMSRTGDSLTNLDKNDLKFIQEFEE